MTDNNFPMQRRWIIQTALIPAVVVLAIAGVFFFYQTFLAGMATSSSTRSRDKEDSIPYTLAIIFIGLIGGLIYKIVSRYYFHFSLEDKFLMIKQGIITREERHIPYGVIQNLIIHQDILDMIFGLATLTIENASVSGGATATKSTYSNSVTIYGLSKQDIEKLKSAILKKMKENPAKETKSGL